MKRTMTLGEAVTGWPSYLSLPMLKVVMSEAEENSRTTIYSNRPELVWGWMSGEQSELQTMTHEVEKRPSNGLLGFENTLQVLKDSQDEGVLAPEAGGPLVLELSFLRCDGSL